jgi:hypothetical protein
MAKHLVKFLLLSLLFTSLFSCASTSEELEILDKSVRSYERAIRWGEFTVAKSFHKADPVLHSIERRRLKLYRVTDYNILSNNTPDQNNAHLLVEIKYYKNDRPVIKTLTVRQDWKRDEDSKIWYVDSKFPEFR